MSEFVGREDFPACTLGRHVDLGGLTGIVVQIVRQSLKLMVTEGTLHSFNVVRLRRLHAPAPRPPAEPEAPAETALAASPEAAPAADSPKAKPVASAKPVRPASASPSAPRRRPVLREAAAPPAPAPVVRRRFEGEPDFTSDPRPISEVANQPDFPDGTLGAHLDIAGFTGVLIETVDQSIKVAAQDGNVRRYNVQALRKLYGTGG